jgi:hypothetical protein
MSRDINRWKHKTRIDFSIHWRREGKRNFLRIVY